MVTQGFPHQSNSRHKAVAQLIELKYFSALLTWFLFESTYFTFICIPSMYFYVDLLIKCRHFEKATKFERTACCFFYFFVLLRISELLSNGHVFFGQSTSRVNMSTTSGGIIMYFYVDLLVRKPELLFFNFFLFFSECLSY